MERLNLERSRNKWLEARTLRDLCELAECFVRGDITVFPGWNAPDLDAESDEIAHVLKRLNRAGFLTCASQPARADQRAFVAGFADRQAAAKLARVPRDVDVRVFGLGDDPPANAEPVSRNDGRAHAFAGHDARADELAIFEGQVGPPAFEALRGAAYVTAFDPEWGRSEHLWNELLRALESE